MQVTYVVHARIAIIRSSFLTQRRSVNTCSYEDLSLAIHAGSSTAKMRLIPEEQPMVQDEDVEDNDMRVEEDNDTFVEQDNDMPGMMERYTV